MRLSGNYIERLLFCILPWTGIIYIVKNLFDKSWDNIAPFIVITLLLWIIDILILYIKYKNPQPLFYSDEEFLYGNKGIDIDAIKNIQFVRDNRAKWSFSLIQFELNDNRMIYSIAKPMFFLFDILGKQNPTEIAISRIPKLKEKMNNTP